MPFVGFIIFQILFVAGLFYVMYQILGRQAKSATEHLSGLSEDYLKKREELKKLTQAAEVQSKTIIEHSKKEADGYRKDLIQTAEKEKTDILEEARKEGERIMQDAIKSRNALLDEIHEQTELKATEQACKLLQKILPTRLREQTHAEYLSEFSENGFSKLSSVQISERIKEIRISSAFPVDSAYKNKLKTLLEKIVGAQVPIEESIDQNLIAGLRIHLGHLVVDASLASKLKEAAQSVSRQA